MQVLGVARLRAEAGVVIGQETRQQLVPGGDRITSLKAQFLDQAILRGLVGTLDAAPRFRKDVLHLMERIALAGAGFQSITENIDTTTPAGRMMMQMIGSFAEFERAMIRERTSAGIAAARVSP